MKKEQIKRLMIVIIGTILYGAASYWVHTFHIVKESSVMNWIFSILAPICVIGVVVLLIFGILDIYDKLKEFILNG